MSEQLSATSGHVPRTTTTEQTEIRDVVGTWRLTGWTQEERAAGREDPTAWLSEPPTTTDLDLTPAAGLVLQVGEDGAFTESLAGRAQDVPTWVIEGTQITPEDDTYDGWVVRRQGRTFAVSYDDETGNGTIGAQDHWRGNGDDVVLSDALCPQPDGSLLRVVSVDWESTTLIRTWHRYERAEQVDAPRRTRLRELAFPRRDQADDHVLPPEAMDEVALLLGRACRQMGCSGIVLSRTVTKNSVGGSTYLLPDLGFATHDDGEWRRAVHQVLKTVLRPLLDPDEIAAVLVVFVAEPEALRVLTFRGDAGRGFHNHISYARDLAAEVVAEMGTYPRPL